MATTPSASVSVSESASTPGAGSDTICILAPVKTQADIVPRLYGNADAIAEVHGYCEGVDYYSFHARETRKPCIFVGLPIDDPGVVGRFDTSGKTGSASVTISEGSDGCMTEHDGVLTVINGGTVGTDQILCDLSLDGGKSTKKVRFGTGDEYTEPYADITITLGAGTLVAGDVVTWHGSGPTASMTDVATARTALSEQLKFFRSALLIGDLESDTEASAFLDELDGYATENQRYIYGRASVFDRLPVASLSVSTHRMTAGTSLTFAEVGASADTVTRATGSWIADGFAVGDTIVITGCTAGSGHNNQTAVIAALTATVLTIGASPEDFDAETTVNATIVGRATLTFANTGETITRNRGSWLADGFRVGDEVTISGTDSNTNDGTFTITTLTALVMTLGAGSVDADEVSPVAQVSISAGQTKAEWAADVDAEFEEVTGFRLDLGMGRAAKASPFTGWNFRRPVSWAASIREYQHDLHVSTHRKSDGPTGWDLTGDDGELVEYDDRVDGGAASAGRFTSFRTWSNGPAGAFITQSLTRGTDGTLLGRTNNVAVVNLAMTIVQFATENVVGRSLVLKTDGTATTDSLQTIQSEVQAQLDLALLKDTRGEGPRASIATWTPNATDVFNVAEPTLTGVLDMVLNGTVHSVNTVVRVRSGGQ